jgi:DNA-binding transcriptional MocR family regulator
LIHSAPIVGKEKIVPDTIWLPELSGLAGPKYQALTTALRQAIRRGDLPEGARLPPVRDLAWRLGMTPGTVARAYQMATQEGLLSGEVGRGTFVLPQSRGILTPRAAPGPREPDVVDMRSPELPDVGQPEAFARALRRMADGMSADWLDYPNQQSEAPLRAEVVRWLGDRVLGPVSGDDIALVNGGQNAICTVFQAALTGERPVVLLEDLAYPGIRHAAVQARAEPVGVEMDQQGMRPDALEAACRRTPGAQIVCLTPQAQNPTAVCMGTERRAEIAAVARAQGLQILEDDCYAVFDSDLPCLRAIAPGRTWYVGSVSKSISASLRFGYVVCPTGKGEAGRQAAQHSFFAMGRPVTDLCHELFRNGAAEQIRSAVADGFAPRLQMVVNMLGAYDLSWQPGVPFVWLRLPKGWRASSFARMAEAEGVLLRSSDVYALTHGRAPNAVRLAIPGLVPLARLEGAVATLARLLASPPQDLAV